MSKADDIVCVKLDDNIVWEIIIIDNTIGNILCGKNLIMFNLNFPLQRFQ